MTSTVNEDVIVDLGSDSLHSLIPMMYGYLGLPRHYYSWTSRACPEELRDAARRKYCADIFMKVL